MSRITHLIFLILLSLFPLSLSAESGDTAVESGSITNSGDIVLTQVTPLCTATGFEIIGDTEATVGSSREYTLYASGYTGKLIEPVFALVRNGEVIETKGGEKYLRIFSQTGNLTIEARVRDETGCPYMVSKPVTIYEKSILSIYTDREKPHTDALESVRKKGFLPTSLALPSSQGVGPGNTLSEFLYKNMNKVKESSLIFLDVEDPVNFIGTLVKIALQDLTLSVNLKGNAIYIVTDQNKNLMGKLLAPHMNALSLSEFFLIEKNMVDSTLLRLDDTLGKGNNDPSVTRISYESTPSFYSVGRLVEFLIYHGVSIAFLGVLLALTVAILVMNFLKQFIGLNIFGMYAPIFMAVSFYFMNAPLVLVLFFVACLATLLGNAFVKRIYLLYNAKHALILTLYFILSILAISLLLPEKYGILEKGVFDTVFIIFPFLMVIFAVDKIFNEEMILWSRASLLGFLQFIAVTVIAYLIIRSQTIQYFLLSYTDVIFVILILNVLIGRFTGLQLFEYARFLPILKSIKEEE